MRILLRITDSSSEIEINCPENSSNRGELRESVGHDKPRPVVFAAVTVACVNAKQGREENEGQGLVS